MKIKIIFLLMILLIITSCNAQINENSTEIISEISQKDDNVFDSISCGLNFKANGNYINIKSKIEKLRNELKLLYSKNNDSISQSNILDSASKIFTLNLLNSIIPFWYGTTWDFNGYTSIPNKGKIACGYFVSTTLKDMNINIDRYKLAQQGPENEAKTIAIDSQKLLTIYQNNIDEELNSLKDGLYFVGLSNHVGYLYINNNQYYFIHSNYIEGKVMIETTQQSEAFKSYVYYIADISSNRDLLKAWLTNKEFKVVTN